MLVALALSSLLVGPNAFAQSTRAERTNYLETSRYADVIAFLDSLKARGAPYAFGSIGKTVEGREIPYVIASRPLLLAQ